jgi:hypothetical protein
MINKDYIDKAQKNIKTLVISQLEHGQQSKIVQKVSADLYSLGQFINSNERSQRGIHGSASGLRVLAEDDANKTYIIGLVSYLKNRASIEQQIQTDQEKINDDKIIRDSNNIIKLSEALHSLSFVKSGHVGTDDYKRELANKINQGKLSIHGKEGWDFFNDGHQNKIEILPSSFAILALAKYGASIDIARITILEKVESEVIENPLVLAEITFCLYSLILSSNNLDSEKKRFKSLLTKIWKSPYCSLQDDYEQNIEYWYNSQNNYIRIPWQIFLIAICSKLSKWKFYTIGIQSRLKSIVSMSQGERGFIYKYSGNNTSTRTNAIVFDTLTFIKANLNTTFLDYSILYWDYVLIFFGGKVLKVTVRGLSLLCILYFVYIWFVNGVDFYSFGKDFIIALFLGLLSFGKKK